MTIYLSMPLSANRKGRFLQSIIGAQPLGEDWRIGSPKEGLLLVQGHELANLADLQHLYDWSMQSGCAALVIEPTSKLHNLWSSSSIGLDWQLVPVVSAEQCDGLAGLVASETTLHVDGFTGSADLHLHHVGDKVHTRYVRKHSNSGLFAVTTLPLWSLNLLDQGDCLVEWLSWFINHAGVVTKQHETTQANGSFEPDQQDMVVLLLRYAGQGLTLQALAEHAAVKILFDVESLNIEQRGVTLEQHGYIKGNTLTKQGQDCLESSGYFAYAELLTEQIERGAQL